MKKIAVKKEAKKPVTIMVRPSIKKAAKRKADSLGDSLSQVIENLLLDYAESEVS